MNKTIYEMLMQEEALHSVARQLMEELKETIPKLNPEDQFKIHQIHGYMLEVNSRMINVFMRTQDERLLGLIEDFQAIIRQVQSMKKDATSM